MTKYVIGTIMNSDGSKVAVSLDDVQYLRNTTKGTEVHLNSGLMLPFMLEESPTELMKEVKEVKEV